MYNKVTIWSGTSLLYVPKKDEQCHGIPSVLGIADDILIAGFDDFSRDDDKLWTMW